MLSAQQRHSLAAQGAAEWTRPSSTPAGKAPHPAARLRSREQSRREKALATAGEVETLEPAEDAPELAVAVR